MSHVSESDRSQFRYLLGELSPADRDRFEDRYFRDDVLHDQLLAAEDELIDAYVRGDLSFWQRRHFKRFFLRSPERHEKLKFAKAMVRFGQVQSRIALEASPHIEQTVQGPRSAFLAYFGLKSPAVRLVFAAVMLTTALVFVVIWQAHRRSEIARKPGETVQEAQTSGQGVPSTNPATSLPRGPVETGSNRAPKQNENPVRAYRPVLSLILSPVERSSDQGNTLVIPPGPHTVRLQLNLEADDYQTYLVTLRTAEGAKILDRRGLKSRAVPGGGRAVIAPFPSQALIPGDFVVQVEGITSDGKTEPSGGYAFRAVRSP